MLKSKRRLNYANVTATVALVFSMSGGALAANHYLINSTKQINPKVLKKLKGKVGKTGKPGVTGAAGATGAAGPAGAPNPNAINAVNATNALNATHALRADSAPLPTTLASGESLTGAYGLIGNVTTESARAGTAISFEIPLAAAPAAHFIYKGETPPAECPGTAAAPKAAPGNLCIYEAISLNVKLQSFENPITGETGGTVQPFGAEVVAESAAGGNYNDSGSWAVTAR